MQFKNIVATLLVFGPSASCSKSHAVKPQINHLLPSPPPGSGNSVVPTIISKLPASGEASASVYSQVTLTFSKALAPSTVIQDNFSLKIDGEQSTVTGTLTYVPESKSIRFKPDARLKSGQSFTATLMASVKDTDGQSLAHAEVWTFSTTPEGWVWISGSDQLDVVGSFGTMGEAAAANYPGARDRANLWLDAAGNIFIANGYAGSLAGPGDSYNDLWKWDGTNWTWTAGNIFPNQRGDFGALNTPAASNMISARHYAAGASAAAKQFIYGGYVYDSAGNPGFGNDLWQWDGKSWVWLSGATTINQASFHGLKGSADAANTPGSRGRAAAASDKDGNLWLFGGSGCDESCVNHSMNDLWKWDGKAWVWIAGGRLGSEAGVYGLRGMPDAANSPGARVSAQIWFDRAGKLWLFGGYGRDSQGVVGNLNDLWQWDGSNWTWVAGSNLKNGAASYGTKGLTAEANTPGARSSDAQNVVVDTQGQAYLFGGYELDAQSGQVPYNDLWRWDGKNWTWVSGDDLPFKSGVYGTKGILAASNIPGARNTGILIDAHDTIWLFGGRGKDGAGATGNLNDLWRYNP